MFEPQPVTTDTTSIVSYMPIPGLGVLPINSFVIHASEPVLVDTGLAAFGTRFLDTIASVIDPADLRWIWITHTDADHVGNLRRVLDAAPRARLVTTYLGMGKLGMLGLPVDRVYLLNPGQSLDVGDRSLLALRPPTWDAPETTGIWDPASRVLFSADSFGALMESPFETASDIPASALSEGMRGWAVVDAPWLHMVDDASLQRVLDDVRSLDPSVILSSHLPMARGLTDTLLQEITGARQSPPFVGPDQAALEGMMSAQAIA